MELWRGVRTHSGSYMAARQSGAGQGDGMENRGKVDGRAAPAEIGAQRMEDANREKLFLDRIGNLIDAKLDTFKQELSNTASESLAEIKKLKAVEHRVFKRKGNEKQFKFNESILDCINDATDALDRKKYDSAKKMLDKGNCLIS